MNNKIKNQVLKNDITKKFEKDEAKIVLEVLSMVEDCDTDNFQTVENEKKIHNLINEVTEK